MPPGLAGAGAKPDKCDGHGYGEGPVHLTGKKMLPVLEGPGVPCAPAATGMPESALLELQRAAERLRSAQGCRVLLR